MHFSLLLLALTILLAGCREHKKSDSHPAHSQTEAIHISSEEGKTWNVLGVEITGKILSEETNGAYSVIMTETPPNGGPPMHLHQHEDELFYVLKGTYEFHYGEKQQIVREGDFIHLPKGIPHRFVNTDSITGITMNTITPGGFEGFFQGISDLSKGGRPSREQIDSIAKIYSLTFVR